MEAILESIGPFGLYHKLILPAFGLLSMISAITVYSTVFTLADPKLVCIYKDNSTNATISDDMKCNFWKNLTDNKVKNSIFECYFDRTYYHDTMITDLSLVCEKKIYASLLQTFYLVGTFSTLVVGFFSDRFGRKKTILIAMVILSIILIFTQLVNVNIIKLQLMTKYIINSIAQFIIGATACVIYVVGFILLSELTTNKFCNLVSTIYLYFYLIGETLVLAAAYFSKNWNTVNLFVTIFTFTALIISYFLIPESPRFLVVHKRFEEAYKILNKIKKRNLGKSYQPLDSDQTYLYDSKSPENDLSVNSEKTLNDSRKNIIKITFLVYIWFAVNMSYYGVSLGITSIGDLDPYLVYLISSIAELVGYFCCHLNDKFNRKKMLIIFFALTGLSCLTVVFVPNNQAVLLITFASIGKAMAAALYNSSYVYTNQMFPTNVRNTFVLLVSSLGRIGSIVSPQINLLQTLVWKPLPYIIFSSSTLIACVFVFILPDPSTLNYF